MWKWLQAVDRILRGEATRVADLRDGTIRIPTFGVIVVTIILGLVYGFFMGWFALINREVPEYRQLLATTLKVPALFFLTLIVTFPSLYVFNALVGSRLSIAAVFRLLIAGLTVTMAVLGSFGPITAFFSLSTENYAFMVLLNVVLFAVAGTLGLAFLLQTLHRLTIGQEPPATPDAPRSATPPVPGETAPDQPNADRESEAPPAPLGALDQIEGHVLGRHVKSVFRCWLVIFALVGAQMSWILRPFIGHPALEFQWFRPRCSSFFEALIGTIRSLFT